MSGSSAARSWPHTAEGIVPDARATEVAAMILAGGEGKRLHPLTRDRAKPAVPFAGRYRMIDFVLSNVVNSGIFKISVLTQYKSGSLMQHLARGWQLAPQMGHYVAPVPATMNLGPQWFRGSADAVFQNLDVIENERPTYVCVFSADHIYKMDVRQMVVFHRDCGAEVTVATIPVPAEEMSRYGIVDCDARRRVTGFREKPPLDVGTVGMRQASMGLYVFNADVLVRAVVEDAERGDSTHDFGRDLIPRLAERGRVHAYDFSTNTHPNMTEAERGYWRDIGTLDAYYQGSMDLISVSPVFNLYNPAWPILSAYYPSPPAKFVFADREQNRNAGALAAAGGRARAMGPAVALEGEAAEGEPEAPAAEALHRRLAALPVLAEERGQDLRHDRAAAVSHPHDEGTFRRTLGVHV